MDVLLTERTEQRTKARNPIRVKAPNLFSYGESITRKICQYPSKASRSRILLPSNAIHRFLTCCNVGLDDLPDLIIVG